MTRGVFHYGRKARADENVSRIEDYFVTGSLDSLSANPSGIIIGVGLADKFQLKMGDKLSITSPSGTIHLMKIVGLFNTGTTNYDESQTFALLNRVQNLLERANVANRFILKRKTHSNAVVAHQIERELGYKTQSWQEASQDLMNLVLIRNLIMYSVVSAILLVASFGIYNVISTVIGKKPRYRHFEIDRFEARDIERIFLIEGAILGLIGSISGSAVGLSLMYGLSRIAIKARLIPPVRSYPLIGLGPDLDRHCLCDAVGFICSLVTRA